MKKIFLIAALFVLFLFGQSIAGGINVNTHMFTSDTLSDLTLSIGTWTIVGAESDTSDPIDVGIYDKISIQFKFGGLLATSDSLSVGFYLQESLDDTVFVTKDSLAAFTSLPSDSGAFKTWTNIVAKKVRIITTSFAANDKHALSGGWSIRGKYRLMQ